MVNDKGEFFHIDFGYILGANPKWFSPAFKLNDALVQGIDYK